MTWGSFRSPTLRNIARDRAVHARRQRRDARTTRSHHYEAGGRTIASGPSRGVGAQSPFKSRFIKGFTLTAEERGDLVAFLECLTDTSFTTDSRFSNPWSAAQR